MYKFDKVENPIIKTYEENGNNYFSFEGNANCEKDGNIYKLSVKIDKIDLSKIFANFNREGTITSGTITFPILPNEKDELMHYSQLD